MTYRSRWDDLGGAHPQWVCAKAEEHCSKCGLQLVESIEPSGFRSSHDGEPTFRRWHSCPTWVTGWRTRPWARFWALPGYGHSSHDADLPLSGRAYR